MRWVLVGLAGSIAFGLVCVLGYFILCSLAEVEVQRNATLGIFGAAFITGLVLNLIERGNL